VQSYGIQVLDFEHAWFLAFESACPMLGVCRVVVVASSSVDVCRLPALLPFLMDEGTWNFYNFNLEKIHTNALAFEID